MILAMVVNVSNRPYAKKQKIPQDQITTDHGKNIRQTSTYVDLQFHLANRSVHDPHIQYPLVFAVSLSEVGISFS